MFCQFWEWQGPDEIYRLRARHASFLRTVTHVRGFVTDYKLPSEHSFVHFRRKCFQRRLESLAWETWLCASSWNPEHCSKSWSLWNGNWHKWTGVERWAVYLQKNHARFNLERKWKRCIEALQPVHTNVCSTREKLLCGSSCFLAFIDYY